MGRGYGGLRLGGLWKSSGRSGRLRGGRRRGYGRRSRRMGGGTWGLLVLERLWGLMGWTYSQDFFFVLVEYMRGEASVGPEPLSRHHIAHTQPPLRHIANMVSLRIHDDVFVRLLESQHHVHQLQLSLHDDGGVDQNTRGRMSLVENAMRVFGDVDWR